MSWRTVVVTGVAKLDYRLDYLVVRKSTGESRVHLSEIGMLIIESTSVSLTAALISELIRHKVKVIFCDEKHNPSSELVPYYGSHDTSAKIRSQISWDEFTKKLVGTEIIADKILKQREHLSALGNDEEALMLAGYIADIQPGDVTNREGHAAKVYFNALFGKDFSRTQENSINAALNYGYGILLSYFTREIVSSGYITQLGLFHNNMFNPFNLASDLMEPFRVLVDRRIVELGLLKFEHDEKMQILELVQDFVTIDGFRRRVDGAIKIYCRSVFEALNEEDVSIIKFYKNEL